MRKFRAAITFALLLAVTAMVLGMLSMRPHLADTNEQAAAPEFDHPIMLCI